MTKIRTMTPVEFSSALTMGTGHRHNPERSRLKALVSELLVGQYIISPEEHFVALRQFTARYCVSKRSVEEKVFKCYRDGGRNIILRTV